jgi:hypothetical protein
MSRRALMLAGVVALSLTAVPRAAADPPSPLAILAPTSLDALSGTLRGLLVRSLPDPLYEKAPGWGHTKEVARGLAWHGLVPEVRRSPKNDGTWEKVRFAAVNPADSLILDVRNPQFPESGRMTFDVYLAFDARAEYTRQVWENGHKLYDGSLRARMRVKVSLSCEATTRLAPGGGLLPDAVFRLHVTRADLSYDNFVTEHAAGVGGEVAKVIGDAFRGGLKKWRPSVERDLLAKADAAIVKAGDTKEVRVNLTSLFTKKGKPVSAPALDLLKPLKQRKGDGGK